MVARPRGCQAEPDAFGGFGDGPGGISARPDGARGLIVAEQVLNLGIQGDGDLVQAGDGGRRLGALDL